MLVNLIEFFLVLFIDVLVSLDNVMQLVDPTDVIQSPNFSRRISN